MGSGPMLVVAEKGMADDQQWPSQSGPMLVDTGMADECQQWPSQSSQSGTMLVEIGMAADVSNGLRIGMAADVMSIRSS